MSDLDVYEALVSARASLIEFEPRAHAGRPDGWNCDDFGIGCEKYHDAVRSITNAVRALGADVGQFALDAATVVTERAVNETGAYDLTKRERRYG